MVYVSLVFINPWAYKGEVGGCHPQKVSFYNVEENLVHITKTFTNCLFIPRQNANESTVSSRHFTLPWQLNSFLFFLDSWTPLARTLKGKPKHFVKAGDKITLQFEQATSTAILVLRPAVVICIQISSPRLTKWPRPSPLEKFKKRSLISTVRPIVHINPSRKQL